MAEYWRVGVAGAVVRRGRVLLVRHTYGEKIEVWTLPGDLTTHQERLDQSVVRELWEETGLDAGVVDLIAVFRMRARSGEPFADGVEVAQTGWFSLAEVRALSEDELLPGIRNTVLAALEGEAGLADDPDFPDRGENARGFLVRRRPAA